MKKNGFTLVEIMVVVIIMGVLTAVGVPKLFGVIAKAKASEVPVAAGTYIHLQNAFLHENNGIGSWKNIGYGAPGGGKTEYFEYRGCIQGKIKLREGGERMVGWQAFNIPKLNYCASYSAWSVILNPLNEHDFNHENLVSSAECGTLTANWEVGEAGVGACEATATLHEIEPEPEPESEPEETPSEEPENNENPSGETSSSESNSTNSTSVQSSNSVDCDALKATGKASDPRTINGNKCGWCYVQECRLAVNNGHLPKGLECVKLCNYESSHNINEEIQQYEDEQKKKEQEQNNNSNANGSNATGSNTNGNGTNTSESGTNTGNTGGNTGSGGGNGGGNGTPTESEGNGESNGTGEMGGTEEEETPVITDQDGKPLNYNDIPNEISCNASECCTSYAGNSGNCKSYKSVSKDQCAVYNTKKSKCTKVR